jgi:serine/threonine protein kinase/WD40 repeat protein
MNEESIFAEALGKTDRDRAAFLDQHCRDDVELRQRLEALLRAHDHPDPFLDAPDPIAETMAEAPESERLGTVIGPYKLLEQIGEGGFGVVFMAEQQEPIRRKVALKIIKPGMDTRQVIARFEAERQALALMDHPNIAKVLDGGTTGSRQSAGTVGSEELPSAEPRTEPRTTVSGPPPPLTIVRGSGRPYFVMELVKGVPITEYCDQNQVPIRERLELFLHVCQAVQHAHQKGIIHRDIKPSNVLVMSQDGTPVVKVIDFGVAKAIGQQLTDRTVYTQFSQLIGTPLYMSPEQAGQNSMDVDTRTDIYALGVLLYELLTGATPFDKERFKEAGYDEMRRIIREEEPPKPSTRLSDTCKVEPTAQRAQRKARSAGGAPGANGTTRFHAPAAYSRSALRALRFYELDWIVMKCLEKDRNRRYETANGLARDIQRFLNDEPVQACPPSLRYRLGKFGRKHGKLLATAAAFALLLITLAVGALLFAWSTDRQLQETQKAQDQTKRELYRSLVAQARANRLSRRTGRRVRSLEILAEATRLAKELRLPEDDLLELRNETIACLPLVDLRVAKTWEGFPAGTGGVNFDGKLEHYVRVDDLKNAATVRRVADDSEISRIAEFWQPPERRSERPSGVVLSPDGEFLGQIDDAICTVWKVTSRGTEVLLPKEPGSNLVFSPDCRRLAIATRDGAISLYELPSGKRLKQWQTSPVTAPWGAPAIAFHPEKPHLAVRSSGRITVLDMEMGNKLAEFAQPGAGDALAWLPDGKRLASADRDRCIYLCDAYTGKFVDPLVGHTDGYLRLAIHPSGDLLASASWDRTLRLWDIPTGREVFRSTWEDGLWNLHFSPNGRFLAADVSDHQLSLWEVIPPCGYRSLVREPHLGKGNYLGLAASGKHPLLAVGMEDGVGLWELPGGRPLAVLPRGAGVTAFEPSGALLASGSPGQFRYPIETIGPAGTLRIGPAQPLSFPPSMSQIAISRDGRVMASAQGWGALVWHADKGDQLIKLAPQYDVRFVAISPEGEWVASGSHWHTDVHVKVWEARTGRHVADLPVETTSRVGFSPDGRWLLTTGGGCRLWEVGTWREGPKIGGSFGFAFSADSKILAVEIGSGVVRLLDPDTGREYARLEDPNQDKAANLAFSPDGSQLFATTRDSPTVHAWDLRALRADLAKRGLDWELPPYPPVRSHHPAPVRVVVYRTWVERGLDHERQGQAERALSAYRKAVADYARLFAASDAKSAEPTDAILWYQYASLDFRIGDLAGYRKLCARMLERFGQSKDVRDITILAHACLLGPDALGDSRRALELAQERAAMRSDAWSAQLLGQAYYRAGQQDKAVESLEKGLTDFPDWDKNLWNWLILAMAHQRLGHVKESKQWLRQATEWMADKIRDTSPDTGFVARGWPWWEWMMAQLLRREAESLLQGKDKDTRKTKGK